jgi:hypothetical protein
LATNGSLQTLSRILGSSPMSLDLSRKISTLCNLFLNMDFSYKNSTLTITSDKKEIILTPDTITLDGLPIDLPGEYEKSSILMYAFAKNDEKLYHFRTE